MTMNGPWANGDRMAFIRIHWSFPAQYPYVPELPSFELERNPTVSPITRAHIVNALKALRMDNRQCLVSTCGFLLGSHERIGRKEAEEESDSDNESQIKSANVVMLIRTCGATFGPNGGLRRRLAGLGLTARSISLFLSQTDGSASHETFVEIAFSKPRCADESATQGHVGTVKGEQSPRP